MGLDSLALKGQATVLKLCLQVVLMELIIPKYNYFIIIIRYQVKCTNTHGLAKLTKH